MSDLTPVWIGIGMGVPLLIIIAIAVVVVISVQCKKRYVNILSCTQKIIVFDMYIWSHFPCNRIFEQNLSGGEFQIQQEILTLADTMRL